MAQSLCYRPLALRNFSWAYRCSTFKYNCLLIICTLISVMMISNQGSEAPAAEVLRHIMRLWHYFPVAAFSGNVTFSLRLLVTAFQENYSFNSSTMNLIFPSPTFETDISNLVTICDFITNENVKSQFSCGATFNGRDLFAFQPLQVWSMIPPSKLSVTADSWPCNL